MGPTEDPERPGETPEALDMEPDDLPVGPSVSPPATRPIVAPPRAPEPVAPRVAPRSSLWWVALSVLLMGSVGFMAGFIGPIILTPSANQGPLLGIFFTGPLGVVLGLGLGIACAVFARNRQKVAVTLLVVGNVLYAVVIVLVILRGGM
jgi:hypothetical protein